MYLIYPSNDRTLHFYPEIYLDFCPFSRFVGNFDPFQMMLWQGYDARHPYDRENMMTSHLHDDERFMVERSSRINKCS